MALAATVATAQKEQKKAQLRQQVEQAKAHLQACQEAVEAQRQEYTRLRGLKTVRTRYGEPEIASDGAAKTEFVGTASEREAVAYALEEAQARLAEAQADYKARAHALWRLEHDAAHAEGARQALAARVDEDADKLAALQDAACALRARFAQWNDHVAAKHALLHQIQQGDPTAPENGASLGLRGQVDDVWVRWLLADADGADDAALCRQFALLAQDKGRFNPVPTRARVDVLKPAHR